MAGSVHSDSDKSGVPDNHEEDEVENMHQESDNNSDDSARGSSDVTWGASDFEAASDVLANDFNSDATYSDEAEPFFDLNR